MKTHHKATAIKSVVLAEEQVNKPVGQNKKLKNRSHLYLGMDTWELILQTCGEKDKLFNRWCCYNWFTRWRKISNTIYKGQFWIIQNVNVKGKNIKPVEKSVR